MRTGSQHAQGIARVDIELTSRAPRAQRRTALWLALLLAVAGAAVTQPGRAVLHWVWPPVAALPAPDLGALEQALEQTRMRLHLSEARSRELERQIDSLNQRLREGQEQLTFFRNARNGKP
ncbi:MAG: hypothetical protein OEW22_04340 [Rubrivivax sp.]|nr:hypothetical protein [Rubrivivax sp.]